MSTNMVFPNLNQTTNLHVVVNNNRPFAMTTSSQTEQSPGVDLVYLRIPYTMTFIFCIVIMLAAVVLNSVILTGMRRDPALKAVTYYYMSSLAVAMLLQAVINMPPSVIHELLGLAEHYLTQIRLGNTDYPANSDLMTSCHRSLSSQPRRHKTKST